MCQTTGYIWRSRRKIATHAMDNPSPLLTKSGDPRTAMVGTTAFEVHPNEDDGDG
jgi:hypothetical protein